MTLEPLFLGLADVVAVHNDLVQRYGGLPGIHDVGLLQSVLAMPQASFGGEWLHRDLHEIAAAYAFHISADHTFVNGNKRTGLACALVFLEVSGTSVEDPKGLLYKVMVDLESGALSKLGFADVLRALPDD